MNISAKIKAIAEATDFGDYIKLLETCIKIAKYQFRFEVQQTLRRVFHAYFQFVNRPSVFEDSKQLKEVDFLHIKFYEQHPTTFQLFTILNEAQYQWVGKKCILNQQSEI